MNARQARERADELILMLELQSCADRRIDTYSGGQKRRLDIGIGLAHRPRLLFLDEPTTGLDPQARARMWSEVKRLRDDGTTIFLTTHYLEEADALCDRLAIIDHGRIVSIGTPDELKRQVAGDLVTLSVDGDQTAALHVLSGEAFVRESSAEDGLVRLYVDRGEEAIHRRDANPAAVERGQEHSGTRAALAKHRILWHAAVLKRQLAGVGGAHPPAAGWCWAPTSDHALSRPSLDDVFLRQTGHSLREESA
jgi:ABC-type multidrug transport system ATPase subunit